MSAQWKMLIYSEKRGDQFALLDEKDRLVEAGQADSETGSSVGTILLGTIERVLPDVGAAFVKIGQKRNGFLPIHESQAFDQNARTLLSGNEEIVQIRRDPRGEKGAMLSRDIMMTGQYVILLPQSRFVGVSKRVTDSAERKACEALGRELAGENGGIVIRHAALQAAKEDIVSEKDTLYAEWEALKQNASMRKAPSVLRRELSPALLCARDYAMRHKICIFCEKPEPDELPDGLEWAQVSAAEIQALYEGAAITRQLKEALKRKVVLPQGGSLVIDEREALQTIDVNSGEAVKSAGESELALEQNLRAVSEIARQIRLRNLSGIIIIDFINMTEELSRVQVQNALEEALRDDRVKTVVHGFTNLGLMEMTRRRTGDSLAESRSVPCRHCNGAGRQYREENE